MAIAKNITFPQFRADYSYLSTLDGQENMVREGLGFYRALAMLVNGDMAYDTGKGSFVGGNGTSIAKLCKAQDWNQSNVSKAATVINALVPNWSELSNDDLRQYVMALVTNHGSVNAAYATVVPPTEPKAKGENTPKSARELVIVALRRHLSDGGDVDGFIALVADVVATADADGGNGE